MQQSIFTILLLLSSTFYTSAQLISNGAFQKLVLRDVNYAILGENAPTQGVSIDITDPKIKINGLMYNSERGQIVTAEFEGKIADGKFTLFENNKFNTSFSLGLSLHLVHRNNSYKWLAQTSLKRLIKKRIELKSDSLTTVITQRKYLEMLIWAQTKINLQDKSISEGDQHFVINKSIIDIIDSCDLFRNTAVEHKSALKEAAKYFTFKDTVFTDFHDLLHAICAKKDHTCDLKTLINDYEKLRKQHPEDPATIQDFEIATTEGFWKLKRLGWTSIQAKGAYQNYMTYTADVLGLKSNSMAAADLNIYYNRLFLSEQYAAYFRFGGGLALGNNLKSDKKRDYTKTLIDTISVSPQIIATQESKGVAYDLTGSTPLSYTLDFNLGFEGYWIPFNKSSFAPGIYAGLGGRFQILMSNTNMLFQLPTELGLVFNVQSKKQNKNYISILPFVGFDNIIKIDSETSNGGVKNWKIGFKIGLPINIGPLKK